VRAKIELSVRLQAQLTRFKLQLAREQQAHQKLEVDADARANHPGRRAVRALPFTAAIKVEPPIEAAPDPRYMA
jgi:hypothetical protein